MAIASVRRRGAYAPLAATYFTDDDIMEAGEAAELLFVRSLAFCAGSPSSDGYVTDKQVSRVFGAGMEFLDERIKMLVEVGLWERLPGGYQVRSWLKWNKSAEELGRFRARDRDRKSAKSLDDDASSSGPEPDPEFRADEEPEPQVETDPADSDFRADSDAIPRGSVPESTPTSDPHGERNPDGVRAASRPLYTTQHSTTQQEETPSSLALPATDDDEPDEALFAATEVLEGEITTDRPNARRSWDNVDLNADPDFRAFWDAYPRKVDKGHARTTWIKIMKKGGTNPAAIIAGAIAFRNDPERPADIKFVPHPATWLNGERWSDYDEADTPAVTGGSDEWWNN